LGYLQEYRIGLLFSTTGSYGVVARSMLNGALLALKELNGEAPGGATFVPVVADPGGSIERYADLCRDLLCSGIKHIVGCYTSSSRKEIIPLIEKHDALLWYPSHYEGFETSNNVIYTGASPNQHIMPLIDHMLARYGSRVVCLGSNYIWAWENNRIMRETILLRGGSVPLERYIAIGEIDFSTIIGEIMSIRPNFVFNTLIGTSAYSFFKQFREQCAAAGINQTGEIPVASCSLSEPELQAIGPDAVDGHISSSVYFSSVATPENDAFLEAYARSYPDGPSVSADAEASFVAAKLLGLSIRSVGSDNVRQVRSDVVKLRVKAPQGEVFIDPDTLHAYLTPRIGRSNRNFCFDVLLEARAPVQPDPYLLRYSPRFTLDQPARLRLVQ